jgi:hypothetical protein
VRRKLRQVGAPKKCAEIFRPKNPETLTKSLGALFDILGAPQKLRFFKKTKKSALFEVRRPKIGALFRCAKKCAQFTKSKRRTLWLRRRTSLDCYIPL